MPMLFNKDKNSIEFELEKDEAKKLVHISEDFHPDELGPEVSDFFGRLQFASAGAHWEKEDWERGDLTEKTRFSLSESGNIEVPLEELDLLYQGVKVILANNPHKSDAALETAIQARSLLEDNLPSASQ